jgi:hypothetical protein
VEYAAESHVADNPEAGEGQTPFERPLGSANGIRIREKTKSNKINILQTERVGCQHHSLRQNYWLMLSICRILVKAPEVCPTMCPTKHSLAS